MHELLCTPREERVGLGAGQVRAHLLVGGSEYVNGDRVHMLASKKARACLTAGEVPAEESC